MVNRVQHFAKQLYSESRSEAVSGFTTDTGETGSCSIKNMWSGFPPDLSSLPQLSVNYWVSWMQRVNAASLQVSAVCGACLERCWMVSAFTPPSQQLWTAGKKRFSDQWPELAVWREQGSAASTDLMTEVKTQRGWWQETTERQETMTEEEMSNNPTSFF